MSDSVLTAMIGVGGTIAGAVATIIVARIQTARAARDPKEKGATTPVLGEAIDIRELRILRALFGEPQGRILDGYKAPHYAPSLKALIRKGWVKRIEGRYYMTTKGAEFSRTYLQEVFASWQAAAQLLP